MKHFLLVVLLGWLSACAGSPSDSEARAAQPAELVVVDQDGKRHDLDAQLARGQRVVLVFWQTWCRSCLLEAPKLAEVARQYPRLTFIGVVPGDAETVDAAEVRRVATTHGLDYPQVLDRDLALTRSFGIRGTPTILVLGEGRKVLAEAHDGDLPWATF